MNCPNCGANMKPGMTRCVKCASVVTPQPPPMNVTVPPAYPGASAGQAQTGPAFGFPQAPAAPGAKSKTTAGVLGILLGSLGIHNFYLGFNGKGTAQLLITLLSFGMLGWVSWVWAVVESVQILSGKNPVDAKGCPLV